METAREISKVVSGGERHWSKTLRSIIILLVASLATPSQAATWLCKMKGGAGFHWDEPSESWRSQTFVVEETYILRPFNNKDIDPNYALKDEPPQYLAVELGKDKPVAFWWHDLEHSVGTQSLVGQFVMSFFSETNEVLVNYTWFPLSRAIDDRSEYTPFIALGKCSKIEL